MALTQEEQAELTALESYLKNDKKNWLFGLIPGADPRGARARVEQRYKELKRKKDKEGATGAAQQGDLADQRAQEAYDKESMRAAQQGDLADQRAQEAYDKESMRAAQQGDLADQRAQEAYDSGAASAAQKQYVKDNSYASVATATPGMWVRNSRGEAQITQADIDWAKQKLQQQKAQREPPKDTSTEERVSSEAPRFYDPATGSWLVANGTKNIPADAIPESQYDSWQEENLKDEDKDEIRGAITAGITGGDFGVTKDKEYTPKKKSASKKTSSYPAYKKARDER